MRDFTKISPLLWRDKRFQSLASSDAKLAYLFHLTSEHQNSAGCYRLLDGYAATDLGWSTERYIQARQEVVGAGLILFDEETSELFVKGWFDGNPPTNPKHAMGTRKLIGNVASDAIREAAEEAFLATSQRWQSEDTSPRSTSFARGNR